MRTILAFTALTALAQTACAAAIPVAAVAVPVGETFTLTVGESASIDAEDLLLTFDGVPRDNRCPKDVQCIVAGAATVALTAEDAGGPKSELTFDVPPGGSATGRFAGFEITVAKVEPGTHSRRRIEPEDYVITLVVERP